MLAHQASATNLLFITLRKSEVLLFVREHRKQDGRPGAPTEPFVCLGFASYESHEGERPMAWGNLCGSWSGRFRRRGYQSVGSCLCLNSRIFPDGRSSARWNIVPNGCCHCSPIGLPIPVMCG